MRDPIGSGRVSSTRCSLAIYSSTALIHLLQAVRPRREAFIRLPSQSREPGLRTHKPFASCTFIATNQRSCTVSQATQTHFQVVSGADQEAQRTLSVSPVAAPRSPSAFNRPWTSDRRQLLSRARPTPGSSGAPPPGHHALRRVREQRALAPSQHRVHQGRGDRIGPRPLLYPRLSVEGVRCNHARGTTFACLHRHGPWLSVGLTNHSSRCLRRGSTQGVRRRAWSAITWRLWKKH